MLSKPTGLQGQGQQERTALTDGWHTVGTQELLNEVRLSEEMDEWI